MAEPFSIFDESDSEVEFTINKNYAENYDLWRNKEEMQKLKDLSKDISDTSSESEEEEDPIIEKDFLKTLSLIKSKDPVIYNEKVEFFKEEDAPKKPKVKKEKPMFMKDYERKLVLEHNGKFSDEDEDDIPPQKPSASEELDEITKSLKAAVDSDNEAEDDGVGGLFQVRSKTKQEEDEEEEEYLQWLKGQKKKVNKETEKDLSFLHKFWNASDLDYSEKFLRDYLLNQRFINKGKSDDIPSYAEITEDALMEEEETLQQQEQFEHKYNYRFEEPDPEFIKRYPRTVGDSLRRVDSKRKEKREEHAERKKREKDQKREELKRLKALKRKEIEEKFFKLIEACGKEEMNFDEHDIESDFDPDKHDEKMKELFDDDYYAVEELQKPEFMHDDEIDDFDWDHWTREQAGLKSSEKDAILDEEEGESSANEDQVTDKKAEFQQEMIDSTRSGKRKARKKSLFAKMISEPKPLYDPKGKSFEEYLFEYYNLDYEDVIGDLPVRFKYRKVIPNDFGLTADEILTANDKELNRWCSVKKTCQYRRDEEELYDVQAFKKKAENMAVKEKILASIYAPVQEDEDGENANDSKNVVGNAKRKKKRSKKKKKSSEKNIANDDQSNAPGNDAASPNKGIGEDSDSVNFQNLSERKNKKKRKIEAINEVSFNGSEVDDCPNSSQQENTSSSEKKKKKRNIESVEQISHDASENNDAVNGSTQHDNISSYKECLDSNNVCNVNLPKKKKRKRKNKANLAENPILNSSVQMPDTGKDQNIAKEKSQKDSSFIVSKTSVEGNEQSNSTSKKSKRKKKRKQFSDEKGGNSLNTVRKPQEASQSDKRLNVSDSRLAAFGINPKKFKSGIIYSKR